MDLMRLYSALLSLAFFSAGALAQSAPLVAPGCAELHLVPAPRECQSAGNLPLGSGVNLVAGSNAEDGFAAGELTQALESHGVSVAASGAVTLRLERAESDEAVKLLALHHLRFDAAMRDEGYILVSDGGQGLTVVAASSAGIFYGAQTVKQLLRGSGKEAVLLTPTVRDWPAMAHRGLSDDWSRGPLPNKEFLEREIRTLAAYKINTFSPYFEHTFAYASTPVTAFPGGAMTAAEARELVAYAARYHIVVIPEQEAFGHLHHVLKFEQFSTLGETPRGEVLAPGEAATLPLIGGWFAELAQAFPGPYAHIGADETVELGEGKTHELVAKQGLGTVYLDFLKQIHTTLAPNHKRLLFWGDIALNSPDLVGTLPKDMIAVPWRYGVETDFSHAILPFTKAGLETWVAPGVSNWSRMYPNNNVALANIRGFVRDGQKLGSTGVLNTVWNDDGEGLFDQNWFGVLFGAAAGWQPGESSAENFTASFGWAFHRDASGKISEAQRELMTAETLFEKAGLYDAKDSYFWADPFSTDGQRIATKMRSSWSELRLHAERAITLVAAARAAGDLDNQEALDALELGARRIDFTGLKFQAADEFAAAYQQALAASDDKSRWEAASQSLSSNGQRLHDIRDGYLLLRGLYRQAWLRDNRSYWLDNNLSHYDRVANLWSDRLDRWSLASRQWHGLHTLPPASELGLPLQTGVKLSSWSPVYRGVEQATASIGGSDASVVYAMRIDLNAPGISFLLSPHAGAKDSVSETTADFAAEHHLQLAINAGFFDPCCNTVKEDKKIIGLSISEGKIVSPLSTDGDYTESLLIDKNNRATIAAVTAKTDLSQVYTAVSGSAMVVKDGIENGSENLLNSASSGNPRTLVGLSREGRYLFMVAVDGRKPGYSIGTTNTESAAILLALGAYNALNLDGGGSTSMVREDEKGKIIEVNKHSDPTERWVANSLGVRALPLPR
jgi:hypothetical protein